MSYFDFYSEGKEEFYNKYEGDAICVYGDDCVHNTPLVSVIVPTYKRPALLKQAVDSVLGQRGFTDFEVIVMDNDAEHINDDTDTFLLMKSYGSDKIRYYRNKVVLTHNQDYGVSLARGKWIVFLHDDDVLNPYHLKVLTQIASKNQEAKYISCPYVDFEDGEDLTRIIQAEKYEYRLYTRSKNFVCLGFYPGWLGALIDRETYVNSGGMPTYCNNLGDYCMVQKFHYKFGVWEMSGDRPLYFRRVWKGQATSSGSLVWLDLYVNEYEYFKYVSKICHPLAHEFWERISSYRILDKAKSMNRGIYRYNIDLMELVKRSRMSKNSLYRNTKYYVDMVCMRIYEVIMSRVFVRKRDEGEIVL